MRQLPQEMILLIGEYARDDLFSEGSREKLSLVTKWDGLERCLEEQCIPTDHLSQKELEECWDDLKKCYDCYDDYKCICSLESYFPDNHREKVSASTTDDHVSCLSLEEWESYHRRRKGISRGKLPEILGLHSKDRSKGLMENLNKVSPGMKIIMVR